MTTNEENELIAEKMLGWEWDSLEDGARVLYRSSDATYPDVPTFTTWAEAGLILDALKAVLATTQSNGVLRRLALKLADGLLDPLAIRTAALEYIRSLP